MPAQPAGTKPEGCVEIFCGNLSYSIDEDKIADFFKDCGTVTNTRWLNDRETQEFKGIVRCGPHAHLFLHFGRNPTKHAC